MTEHISDPHDADVPEPEPLKLDVPVYDYVEKSDNPSDLETRDGQLEDRE